MRHTIIKSYFDLVYLAPALLAILIPITLVLTYIWAAFIRNDVIDYLPYISETYDDPPQAIYYAQMFDLIFILMTFSCIVRYVQLDTILNNEPCTNSLNFSCKQVIMMKKINTWGLAFALLLCLSILLLSSTRLNENYTYHYILATTVFVTAPFMYILQTWISFKFRPTLTTALTAYSRLMIAIVSVLDIGVFLFARLMANSREDKLHQNTWHVVAAHTEYVFVLLISPFAFTYVSEIKRLKCIKSPEFVYHFDAIIHTHNQEITSRF